MRVLVTGATGFLGRGLCPKLLDDGYELMGLNQSGSPDIAMNSKSIEYVAYKMGDKLPKPVIDFSPEVIVHLAWDGIPDFSAKRCLENVKTQLRFFKELENLLHLKKILVAGTCREYGAKQGSCSEDDYSPPDSYFSWAKQTLRDYLILSCQQRAVNLIWFRVFYVYGQGQRAGSLIPSLIKAFNTDTKPVINDPDASNDFIYIDDVVSAFLKAIENQVCHGTFNLGSGCLSSVAEITKLVEYDIIGSEEFSGQLLKNSKEIKKKSGMWANINLSNHILGWKPKTNLSDGIKRICQLYNDK